MEATVIRMGGQTRQAGNGALTDAIMEGMTEGRSRAEMRAEIERLSLENAQLRQEMTKAREQWARERRARVNADIECRAKGKALIEMRRGNAGAWAQLLELSSARRRNADRFLTVVCALTCLGAVALILMAVLTLAG